MMRDCSVTPAAEEGGDAGGETGPDWEDGPVTTLSMPDGPNSAGEEPPCGTWSRQPLAAATVIPHTTNVVAKRFPPAACLPAGFALSVNV